MEIVNIVTSGTLGQKVDLSYILQSIPEYFSYDPELYHGGYLKLSNYVVTIYKSGKYIIPGVKYFEDIDGNYLEMKDLLKDVLDVELIQKADIRNMVANSNFGQELNLNRLCMNLLSNTNYDVHYEPEVFPGLCIKLDCGSANIYRNGKYLLLGVSNEKELIELDGVVYNLIKEHCD